MQFRRSLVHAAAPVLAGAAALLLAGAASALPAGFYYDVVASEWRAQATLAIDHGSPLDVDWSAHASPESNDLGHVGVGDPAVFTHHFEPSTDVSSIEKAWLVVGVTDDQFLDRGEEAVIELDGDVWKSGGFFLGRLFLGDITANALIAGWGDSFSVTVASSRGDFIVWGSALKVAYEPGQGGEPSGAVPEPSAALVFGLGALLVGRRAARR